jgi:hypothetical protein
MSRKAEERASQAHDVVPGQNGDESITVAVVAALIIVHNRLVVGLAAVYVQADRRTDGEHEGLGEHEGNELVPARTVMSLVNQRPFPRLRMLPPERVLRPKDT